MDKPDRTRSIPIEIPDELLPVLRDAADEGLERACDNMGEWDDEIRTRVLDAARLVEVSDLRRLTSTQIADLADNALKWAEPLVRLRVARELVKLRDLARQMSDQCEKTESPGTEEA